MPRHCCVPGCTANYASSLKSERMMTTFSFPKEEHLRQQWIRSIHRDSFEVSSGSVVCEKHFNTEEIIRVETYKNKDGILGEFPLKRPKLCQGAVPHIFPNQPKYLTKPLTTARIDPETRRKKFVNTVNQKTEAFLKSDIINTFVELCENVKSKISLKDWDFKVTNEKLYFFLLNVSVENLDIDESIYVISTVVVDSDLKVKVFSGNSELSICELRWILPEDRKLNRWSQIDNLLARYRFTKQFPNDYGYYVEKAYTYIQKAIYYVEKDSENLTLLQLLSDQLSLINKKRKMYSLSSTLFSLIIYCQSSSTYDRLKDFLILPTKRHLQQISADLNVFPNNNITEENTYLSYLSSNLTDQEKVVCLLVDEIYIKTGLQYKAKNVTGYAENNASEFAKTIQTFMISSPFGHFKEVIRLVPVQKMTGNQLSDTTLETVNLIQKYNFKVLCIITDNNKVNQKMFSTLSENIHMDNPAYINEKIFLTYDFVHIFKNIYFNWLNLKNYENTFIYPDFDDFSKTKKASFAHIRQVYKKELSHVAKRAYKLNDKTVFPNNLERQNVNLAENVFHDSTIAALKCHEEYTETSEFLQIIKNWWSIVNLKSAIKGKLKRQEFCKPILSSSDNQIDFLKKFVLWLNHWNSDRLNNIGLTKDTFNALKRSTEVLISLIEYSFRKFKLKYILPGMFQTDTLERRFGRYRNLSGCNYNISFYQVLESEKKIRLQNLLKSCDPDQDLNFLRTFFLQENNKKPTIDISDFSFILDSDYLQKYEVDESVQLYVCGYAAHSLQKKLKCSMCKLLVIKSKGDIVDDDYFKHLQRGGLCIATDEVGYIYYHISAIFNFIQAAKNTEQLFFNKSDHKNLLATLSLKSLEPEGFFINFNEVCECGASFHSIYYAVALIFANIILNNYVKNKNSEIHRDKNSNAKKRKLTTYQ